MKIKIWTLGKTKDAWIHQGLEHYQAKLKHYLKVEYKELVLKTSGDKKAIQKQEGQFLLQRLENSDFLVLLDENGRHPDSMAFAKMLEKWQVQSIKTIVMIIGGPFGHGEQIRQRAQVTLSLSKLTFTHDMARLILLEQLYRGMSILRNEPYHNV